MINGTPVVESDSLKFQGYILDSKGLWSAHIDYVVAQSRKCVGALRRICDYLSPADLCTAYKAFVRLQLEYGHLLYWGAAESHLVRLDRVQLQAQRLFSEIPLPTLESRRVAAAVRLTCRLLSGNVSSPLLSLTPVLMSSTGSLPRRSARLTSHSHQFLDQCTYRSFVLWRCLRGLIGGGFLTSGTVSNRICWLLLDLPGLPAVDHYNIYVLFISNIDFDCNVYIPLLFTV